MNRNWIVLLITSASILSLILIYTFVPQSKTILIVDFPQRISFENQSKSNVNQFEIFSKSDYDNQTRIPSNGVIAILVASPTGDIRTNYNPYPKLVQKMIALDKYFDDQSKTDVIIFHTGYPRGQEMIMIFHATLRQVHFINVDPIFYLFPSSFLPHLTDPNWTRGGKWNFHHMSDFWFNKIFQLKFLQRYKYILRFDDDSQMKSLWSNVFEVMDGHQAVYLINDRDIDQIYVYPGIQRIRNFTIDFIKKHNIRPVNIDLFDDIFKKLYELPTFLTHFEVINFSFMQRADVKQFIDAVDRSHGIYLYRWSDGLLRYVQMALFAESEKILYRKNLRLSYCHPC